MDYLLWSLLSLDALVGIAWLLTLLYQVRELSSYPQFFLRKGEGSNTTLLSVIIPARNEEKRIGRCLESVSQQRRVRSEIIVVDDESNDRTTEIVDGFARKDNRVRLVRGAMLPEGWVGKNWACHQGFLASSGEWLLFLDSDSFLHPETVTSSLARVEQKGLHALSIFPAEDVQGFWAKMVWPVVAAMIRTLYPLREVADPKGRSALVFGAYVLIERASYLAIGGHERVRSELVEDKQIGANLKSARVPYEVVLGRGMVVSGLASGFGRIWNSIRRIASNPTRGSMGKGLGFVTAGIFMFIFPFAVLMLSVAEGEVPLEAVVVALISFFSPAAIVTFDIWNGARPSYLYSLLATLGGTLIVLGVLREILKSSDLSWRGRTYVLGSLRLKTTLQGISSEDWALRRSVPHHGFTPPRAPARTIGRHGIFPRLSMLIAALKSRSSRHPH
ncbi:MAG: glycosyltransferase [Thaumarchaeota archaeon]|nr:glycosyltransferase [Nitrososphaerota archaeon]